MAGTFGRDRRRSAVAEPETGLVVGGGGATFAALQASQRGAPGPAARDASISNDDRHDGHATFNGDLVCSARGTRRATKIFVRYGREVS
jgi:hypothetical protein